MENNGSDDIRQKLNQMVIIEEDSFSCRGIELVDYGFTCNPGEGLWFNGTLKYSEMNNSRACSNKLEINVYDCNGSYLTGMTEDLDGHEKVKRYLPNELMEHFSKITLTLKGDMPQAITNPEVIQTAIRCNGIGFDFDSASFALYGIAITSCGSTLTLCNKSYMDQQDVFFELKQLDGTVSHGQSTVKLNVLLYDRDGTFMGTMTKSITDQSGKLQSRIVTMQIKVSKRNTVHKIKIYLD